MSAEGLPCMDRKTLTFTKEQESFVLAKSFPSISSNCDFLGYAGRELRLTEYMPIIKSKKHQGRFQSQTSAI